MIVALFEDEKYGNFSPLTHTRPVFELRSGMLSLRERAQRTFHDHRIVLFARDYLSPILRKKVRVPVNRLDVLDDGVLMVNGALSVNKRTREFVQKKLAKNVVLAQRENVVLAHVDEKIARRELSQPVSRLTLKRLKKECRLLRTKDTLLLMEFLWDLVNNSASLIKDDFASIKGGESAGTIDDRAAVNGEMKDVFVGARSFVEAFVTLDARGGPIYIGEGCVVQSGSRISGPAHIGDQTIIASGLVREGCSIGRACRVGGELEETVIQGFTNKYHTSFIGHSYIGEWVNIGAATTNSNLKNTYGPVHVEVMGKRINTHHAKVGSFIGDHAKTSIGTQIYTGIKIGVASHVHGFVTENVPSFTIWAKHLGAKPVELRLESALETQKRVLARRGLKQTREDIELLKEVFRITAVERRRAGVVRGRFEL